MICYYYDAPTYLFFASDLPALLYYSHIPATVIALLVGIFVLLQNPRALLNRLLFAISLSFFAWTTINLFAWTNINSDLILFFWTFFGVFQALISVLAVYFVYVFVHAKDAPTKMKLTLLALASPVLLFATTDLNVSGFDLAWCDAFLYEGVAFLTYYSFLGLVTMFWIFGILTKGYKNGDSTKKTQFLLMGIGMGTFLFLFFTLTYIGSMTAIADFYESSQLEFYGLFGMTIFMVMISVLIVRFKAFNISTHVVNVLVIALLLLVASQYTYVEDMAGAVLTSITLALSALISIMLVSSVKKEVKQKKELEKLTGQLKKANKRLKVLDQMKSEFVSIASHQLRSPLTSIRGYASMLLEGSFGNISQKGREAIERISESSRYMAMSVEDYLNVSRIEAGRMKYEMSDFNIRDMVEHLVDDIRPTAIKKGLVLTSKTSELSAKGIVHGDIGKTQQIIHNLIDNALKYTPKGTVVVRVHDNPKNKTVYIDVVDSGVGMEKDAIDDVFEKFVRAKNANEVNVTGTGLGLYVAKKMAEGMGGTITADSEGKGKGSVFTLALPLHM